MKCIICKTKDAKHGRGYCGWCAQKSALGDLIITLQGIDEMLARIKQLEDGRDSVVKIKATEVVNENISAELGIPDRRDVITIQCFGPSHDGQWVRRSSYNQLSDEARRRDKQLTLALDRIDDLEKQLINAGTAMNDQMDLAMKRIGELSMSPGSVELEHQIIRHVEKNGRWVVKLCDDKGVEKEYVIEEKSQ